MSYQNPNSRYECQNAELLESTIEMLRESAAKRAVIKRQEKAQRIAERQALQRRLRQAAREKDGWARAVDAQIDRATRTPQRRLDDLRTDIAAAKADGDTKRAAELQRQYDIHRQMLLQGVRPRNEQKEAE